MKRLILMRHAKSSWDDPALDDHARALNARGRRSAKALGDWLRDRGHLPDRALVSSAARTHETYRLLAFQADAELTDSLYHADPDSMLTVLRGASSDRVLMLGHNPGIAWFARSLLSGRPEHPRFDDFPTGATLVADFDIPDWCDLRPGTGRVVDFTVPRDLDS